MENILFTHSPDIDGMGSAVLLKLIDPNAKIVLCENYDLDEIIVNYFNNNDMSLFDNIFICDLPMDIKTAKVIDESSVKNKVKVFDHHKTGLPINDFTFAKVIVESEIGLECGTNLFYNYLLENYEDEVLRTNIVKEFVELTRQHDTWEWFTKYNNEKANELNYMFTILGSKRYINYFTIRLKNNEKELFASDAYLLLELEKEKIDEYTNKVISNIIIDNFEGYKIAIVYADLYRNEIATKLQNYDIDFIMIINLMRTSISLRTRDNKDIDLDLIAKKYNGGGHKKAASIPLDKKLYNKIFNNLIKEQ